MLPTTFRFIWPSGFRVKDFRKSANQKQELPMAAMFVNGSWQNEQSLERTFHRCFLPSFSSYGWGVSEEKIKMWKVNGLTTDAKWWQKLTPSNNLTNILNLVLGTQLKKEEWSLQQIIILTYLFQLLVQ